MQDAITKIVNTYDLTGRYLDESAIEQLSDYFVTGIKRVKITEFINEKAAFIIKEASAQLFNEQPELLRPGGNAYTTRRYAACLRDIEYYLRYATYALVAGDNNILDQRVLDGLKDTYGSLSVPIAPTVRSIDLLKKTILEILGGVGTDSKGIVEGPFDYMVAVLGEEEI